MPVRGDGRSRRPGRCHHGGDGLSDQLGGSFDIAVREMGVAQRHLHIGMPEHADDDRQRYAVHLGRKRVCHGTPKGSASKYPSSERLGRMRILSQQRTVGADALSVGAGVAGYCKCQGVQHFQQAGAVALTARRPCPHAPAMAVIPPSAAAIWRAASNADRDTGPARARLAALGVWPPWQPLPPGVRFLSAPAAAAALALPGGAAGVILFAYTAGAGRKAHIAGWGMEALTRDGQPLAPRWRRLRLESAGGAFGVPGPDGPGYPLHLTAGPIDALAISTWRGRRAWAAGGTAGLRTPALARAIAASGREIVMEPPGDWVGREASEDMVARLQRLGVRARIVWRPEGIGPTDALAASWAERAAELEYGNGMDRRDAESAAWNECPRPETGARSGR